VSVIAEIDRLRDILSLSVEAQGTLELLPQDMQRRQ